MDGILIKYSTEDNQAIIWGSYIGRIGTEVFNRIAPVNDSIFYVVGSSSSVSSISTTGSYQEAISVNENHSETNQTNAYVMKFVSDKSSVNTTNFTQSDFGVYPNPTFGNITIIGQLEVQTTIEIFNVLGQKVHTTTLEQNFLNYQMYLQFLAKGTYLLKISTPNNYTQVKKIILN